MDVFVPPAVLAEHLTAHDRILRNERSLTVSVLYRRDGAVAIISLNRPAKLNAIDLNLVEGLTGRLDEAFKDDAVSVIVLRAEGRAFCAGDDLGKFNELPDAAFAEKFVDRLQMVTRQIMLGSKPVICAAQGWIVGGGAAWLLNADFCLISGTAMMFLPEARYGMFPSGGMSILLTERCGAARAAELMWLGEQADAKALVSLGIATQIFASWQLEEQALVLAQRLADLPAESRNRYKLARSRDIGDRLERALQFEAQCCLQAGLNADTRLFLANSGILRHP